MSEKFKNKYRIASHRLKHWDYSANGIYFITIITQDRICNLGEIKNGKMILSDFGKIVNDEWYKSFDIRNELFLDEYIIMPNHIHAIVVLNKMDNNVETDDRLIETDDRLVETHGRASLHSRASPAYPHALSIYPHTSSTQPVTTFYRLPKSISSFLAGFKSAVNTKIDDFIDEHYLDIPKYNRNNHFFQPNYHDHIIRNNKSYNRIKNYILTNPENWTNDKFYKNTAKS